jgi:hypothetical protein
MCESISSFLKISMEAVICSSFERAGNNLGVFGLDAWQIGSSDHTICAMACPAGRWPPNAHGPIVKHDDQA